MLELEGIYAPSHRISFLKVNIFHHPEEFGRKIKLIFNIELEMTTSLQHNRPQKELEIFINTKPGVEVIDIEDLSYKMNKEYATGIGAYWDPDELRQLKIINIPKAGEYPRGKLPYHFDSKSGKIKINLKFEERSRKNEKGGEETEMVSVVRGMIFFAIYLEGSFLEEDPWWKKLLGLSRYAWEFSYIFWSHGEKSLIPTQSIGECREAQSFIIIPKKMIKSIDRVSCMPGNDQLHKMTANDIATYCESENNEEKIRKIKEWVEPGSYSMAWKIPHTLRLSKMIILGHLDAYPPSIGTILFSFIILFYLLFNISFSIKSSVEFNILQFLILIVIYFFISAINYSFHNIRQSEFSHFLYEMGGIIIICFLISLGFYGSIPWELHVEPVLSEVSPISWILVLFPTIIILMYISYREDTDFISYSSHSSRLASATKIVSQCFIILMISIIFSYIFELGDYDHIILEIVKYWTLNNVYATVGIKGLHKLIE